jgi:hypothetical protein
MQGRQGQGQGDSGKGSGRGSSGAAVAGLITEGVGRSVAEGKEQATELLEYRSVDSGGSGSGRKQALTGDSNSGSGGPINERDSAAESGTGVKRSRTE